MQNIKPVPKPGGGGNSNHNRAKLGIGVTGQGDSAQDLLLAETKAEDKVNRAWQDWQNAKALLDAVRKQRRIFARSIDSAAEYPAD